MKTCSMCRKEVEVLGYNIADGKPICPECARRIKELLESGEPGTVRDAVNYVYTCAKAATDQEVSDYLFSILENNASAIQELEQTKKEKTPVNLDEQADYFEDRKNEEESGTGFGCGFMKFVAWLLWIGGLILSIVLCHNDFAVFFQMFILYFFAGAFAMCFSELFKNVSIIKNELCKLNKKNPQ